MVAGHLQEKNGIYYVVLTYKTYDGKRKTKWQSTGLPIKGNKRRAEAMMRELQDDFEPPVDPQRSAQQSYAVCGLSGAMAGNRKVNRQADNLRKLQRTVEQQDHSLL